jgi:hypothetical protein
MAMPSVGRFSVPLKASLEMFAFAYELIVDFGGQTNDRTK